MELVTIGHVEQPAQDMALTETMLKASAARAGPEVIRIFRPGPTVAFGRADQNRPGFPSATEAARAHHREPIVRLAGGHAATYDGDCVLIEIIRHETDMTARIESRYEDLADLLRVALAEHGVAVDVAEQCGEYCAGRFSLHLAGHGRKVAGIAQRIIKGASLTAAVLVVDGGDELRGTISDVYRALEIAVEPDLAGALSDRHAGLTSAGLAGTLRVLAHERYRLTTTSSGRQPQGWAR